MSENEVGMLSFSKDKQRLGYRTNWSLQNFILSFAVHMVIFLCLLLPSSEPLQEERENLVYMEFSMNEMAAPPPAKVEAQPMEINAVSETHPSAQPEYSPPPPLKIVPIKKVMAVNEKQIKTVTDADRKASYQNSSAKDSSPKLEKGASEKAKPPMLQAATSRASNPQKEVASDSSKAVDERQRYLANVRKSIESHKRYPKRAALQRLEGRVGVRFFLSGSGLIDQLEISKGSGHDLLDKAALNAVRNAVPFPQMPTGIFAKDIQLELTIVFELR